MHHADMQVEKQCNQHDLASPGAISNAENKVLTNDRTNNPVQSSTPVDGR